ncbi:CotH kinase family protein [bacterium]|nr:CotH kinase family protein [bacterium]MBU1990300.1 CotH kinase family protein [bacterium]
MFKSIFISIFLFFMITGCSSYNDADLSPSVIGDIKDSSIWYSDMKDDVLVIRVTIPEPNEYECVAYDDLNGSLRPCTLEDVNNDIDANDAYEPLLHINMQTDDFLSSNETMNASFEQKGKTTRTAAQKSYRIKLDSSDILYKKERTFQLNKHPNDYSRVKNKLAFDLFRDIPNITSLKTQFVNLWINGNDYGLFSHVEKVGKEFLINRGWNEDDNLYKAQEFAFKMVDALKIDGAGQPINPDLFDAVIEIERGKDHTKFIEMLYAVNQSATDAEFEKVFSRYFNRNNYITWMAVNLIMANKDTVSQNFYLYNPLYSDTFYFLPWDYDGAGRATEEYAKWQLGIGAWWGIPLHKRFLKIKKNREDLDLMVKQLRAKYVTPETIQERLDLYEPLITPYLSVSPDLDELSITNWRYEFDILIPRLDENIQNYTDQIGSPMPFWQGSQYEEGILTLSWEESVDLEGDEIVYDVLCADNPDFNNSIVNEVNLSVSGDKVQVTSWGTISYEKELVLPSGGKYFMKVTAKEKNNPQHYQIAFDKEVVIDTITYFGLLEFTID